MSRLTAENMNFNPPRFGTAALRAFVMSHWGMDGTLKPLAGEGDQNHRFDCMDGESYVLKVSSNMQHEAVIDFELQALQHIGRKDPKLLVPQVIPTKDHKNYTYIAGDDGARHMVRMLSWVNGVPVDGGGNLSEAVCISAAATQAKLILALQGFNHPSSDHFLPWDIKIALILDPEIQAHNSAEAKALTTDFLAQVGAVILPKMKGLRSQVVHGDGHAGNHIRLSGNDNEVVGVIDFGDMVWAPLVQDLAVMTASYSRVGEGSLAIAAAQVGAFNAICPLEDKEIDILYDLILMRLTTALFMYDYQLSQSSHPAGSLEHERPAIIRSLQYFLSLDRREVVETFHRSCESR